MSLEWCLAAPFLMRTANVSGYERKIGGGLMGRNGMEICDL